MLMKKPLVSLVAGLMLLIIIIETSMIASIYFKNSNTNATHPIQGTSANPVQNSALSNQIGVPATTIPVVVTTTPEVTEEQTPPPPFTEPVINQASTMEPEPSLVINSGSPYYGEETGIPTENFTV